MDREFTLRIVRIFVSDWERAIRFYTETLGIPLTYRSDQLGWAQLETGECNLALERTDPADPESTEFLGRFVCASLQVEDIQRTYERMVERGVSFLAPPEQQVWGGTLANFRDPDGNVLTLLGSAS